MYLRRRRVNMVVRHLKYTIASQDSQQYSYINLARDLSAMNRQLFRQARMYKVKSITLIDDDESKYVQFGIAGDTWAMRNSVKRAYRRWNEMNDQVLAEQPELKARWNDFKPYVSQGHYNVAVGGAGTVESPEDIQGNKVQYGEWVHSVFESPDGTTSADGYVVGILGDHLGTPGDGNMTYVGLIQSYGDARGTISNQEPTVSVTAAADDPLVNLLDAGTQFDEIVENIVQEGDEPPYMLEKSGNYGGAYVGAANNLPDELMVAELNSSSATDGLQRIYNLDVPLGVIRIDHATETGSTNFSIVIELAEGKYKGIHSESLV